LLVPFARYNDDAISDIGVLVVRPIGIGEEDFAWSGSIARQEDEVRRISANPVNRIEERRSCRR
jgi:hypothetical protein